MQEAVAAFLAQLADSGRVSPATLAAYGDDLGRFAAFLQNHGIDGLEQVDRAVLRAFIMSERARGVGVRSLRRRFAALRALYRHGQRQTPQLPNPALDFPIPKEEHPLPDWLTVDQAQALMLAGSAPDSFLLRRDQAILELLYSSALRVSELVGLGLDDLDRREGSVRVTGKGQKVRLVPVGKPALLALDRYLELRRGLAQEGETAVFINRSGRRMSVRSVQDRVERAGRTRLGQHLHPHTLRHSAASHFLQSAGDLRAVQEYLGHAGIGTTAIYTHLDYQQLAKVYDENHPRAKQPSPPLPPKQGAS
ncbi:MAG: integrase [Acidithiobacillus ferrivorans]|uniref:Integrase n=1 Tax=Acidithiobacillus ferrivorans TaxID=160808 RepID=A0A257T809_9PROT|nr:MAG: integrase [Acidithiobacillus ferrivorans]